VVHKWTTKDPKSQYTPWFGLEEGPPPPFPIIPIFCDHGCYLVNKWTWAWIRKNVPIYFFSMSKKYFSQFFQHGRNIIWHIGHHQNGKLLSDFCSNNHFTMHNYNGLQISLKEIGCFAISLATKFLSCNDHLQLHYNLVYFYDMNVIRWVALVARYVTHRMWNCIHMKLVQLNYNYARITIMQLLCNCECGGNTLMVVTNWQTMWQLTLAQGSTYVTTHIGTR
jgi:hypothetical protein